jgi:hypothetical protein
MQPLDSLADSWFGDLTPRLFHPNSSLHDFIERLWREHVDGRNVWTAHLWTLLNFELWHRVYPDGETIMTGTLILRKESDDKD